MFLLKDFHPEGAAKRFYIPSFEILLNPTLLIAAKALQRRHLSSFYTYIHLSFLDTNLGDEQNMSLLIHIRKILFISEFSFI